MKKANKNFKKKKKKKKIILYVKRLKYEYK